MGGRHSRAPANRTSIYRANQSTYRAFPFNCWEAGRSFLLLRMNGRPGRQRPPPPGMRALHPQGHYETQELHRHVPPLPTLSRWSRLHGRLQQHKGSPRNSQPAPATVAVFLPGITICRFITLVFGAQECGALPKGTASQCSAVQSPLEKKPGSWPWNVH